MSFFLNCIRPDYFSLQELNQENAALSPQIIHLSPKKIDLYAQELIERFKKVPNTEANKEVIKTYLVNAAKQSEQLRQTLIEHIFNISSDKEFCRFLHAKLVSTCSR